MEVCRRSSWLLLLVELFLIALRGVDGELDTQEGPSESECRPYIEKALKQLETPDTLTIISSEENEEREDIPTVEVTDEADLPVSYGNEENSKENSNETAEEETNDENDEKDRSDEGGGTENETNDDKSEETVGDDNIPVEKITIDQILAQEPEADTTDDTDTQKSDEHNSEENLVISEPNISKETEDNNDSNVEVEDTNSAEEEPQHLEVETITIDQILAQEPEADTTEDTDTKKSDETNETENLVISEPNISKETEDNNDSHVEDTNSAEEEPQHLEVAFKTETEQENESKSAENKEEDNEDSEENEVSPVEELVAETEQEVELRPTEHITKLLKLDEDSSSNTQSIDRMSEIILRDLKKLYDTAIKPLEVLYKYKDLSNRHYGDSEIFAKPLILFMGPWSGGKSTIINYLLGIDQSDHALHTGAEPSPAYFNILTYGEEAEVLDGTQLAADYTFSGLQKFGQGLEERLRGYKLPRKLLKKVNIVEIPGILEVRKQVSRSFPFNDACQWFIDRADIIFLIYDPSKLDVGPETEAILDQLKGREQQTRIVLNKADQVKPEELMRVQGALIWNISPLMSSAQPPIMYTTSLWAKPYEEWAPVRLLQAQERAFLRDIHHAVDKRIDNKIASARRFAVRVRNHAKMVDCYLTTYYNHKSVFGNRKQISDEIINHPQDFHIYEGLSTLTNISRYDLPDPDVYRDFFRLNALYEFQQLSATCTYFRGCPINRLDVAIAYDLPELVGKHKKLVENSVNDANKSATPKS